MPVTKKYFNDYLTFACHWFLLPLYFSNREMRAFPTMDHAAVYLRALAPNPFKSCEKRLLKNC